MGRFQVDLGHLKKLLPTEEWNGQRRGPSPARPRHRSMASLALSTASALTFGDGRGWAHQSGSHNKHYTSGQCPIMRLVPRIIGP